jgi:hypothetical protein
VVILALIILPIVLLVFKAIFMWDGGGGCVVVLVCGSCGHGNGGCGNSFLYPLCRPIK